MVGPETDGGGNHNHRNVRNQLSLFSLFILGDTDKLNVTCGHPCIYFINTPNRAVAFMNIGISDLVLKSNVQVVHELFMDEVIGKE